MAMLAKTAAGMPTLFAEAVIQPCKIELFINWGLLDRVNLQLFISPVLGPVPVPGGGTEKLRPPPELSINPVVKTSTKNNPKKIQRTFLEGFLKLDKKFGLRE